jgi:hypothetical protein
MTDPNTEDIALDGLRQAFQTRVVQLWTVATVAGASDPGPKFRKGFEAAAVQYEKAWHAVKAHFANGRDT